METFQATSATALTVVVIGAPPLSAALNRDGRFAAVLDAPTTRALTDLHAKSEMPVNDPERKLAFLFADNVPVNTPDVPLRLFIQRLSTTGWRTGIVNVGGQGGDLAAEMPAAYLIDAPVSLNAVLFALSAMNISDCEPTNEGGQPIDFAADPPAHGGHVSTPPTQPAPNHPDGGAATLQDGGAPQPAAEKGTWRPAVGQEGRARTDDEAGPAVRARVERHSDPPAGGGFQSSGAPQPPVQPPAGGGFQSAGAPQPPAGGGFQPAGAPQPPSGGGFQRPSGGPVPAVQSGWSTTSTATPTGFASHGFVGGATGTAAPGRNGYVISSAAPKGGTGKSTTSLNLAEHLARAVAPFGKQVCLLDCNIGNPDIGKLLESYRPNVADLVGDPSGSTPQGVQQYIFRRDDLAVHLLLGPDDSHQANLQMLTPKRYNLILDALRDVYDFVVIDTPVAEPNHSMLNEFALPRSDFVLVLINPYWPAILNANQWLRTVTASEHAGGVALAPDRVGVVLNRAEEGVGITEKEARQEMQAWRYLGPIPETVEIKRATNNAQVARATPGGELFDAFNQVLYGATGEQALLTAQHTQPSKQRSGLLNRLRTRK